MIDPNISKSFKGAVDNNVNLVETLSEQIMNEAKEEKQRRIAVEQHYAMDIEEEKQRRIFVEQERDQLRKERKNIEEAGRQPELRRSIQQRKLEEEQQQQRVNTNITQLVTKGQMQTFQNENTSGKFIFVGHYRTALFLSSDNTEYIHYYESNNLDSLVHNILSYQKELLIWTYWGYMNTTSGYATVYANLLSLCQKWKRLRPDGEIHCLYWYNKGESLSKPDKELVSLLTTCNKYPDTAYASRISAIRQYWPKFVDMILSEETKANFPE